MTAEGINIPSGFESDYDGFPWASQFNSEPTSVPESEVEQYFRPQRTQVYTCDETDTPKTDTPSFTKWLYTKQQEEQNERVREATQGLNDKDIMFVANAYDYYDKQTTESEISMFMFPKTIKHHLPNATTEQLMFLTLFYVSYRRVIYV